MVETGELGEVMVVTVATTAATAAAVAWPVVVVLGTSRRSRTRP